jgi:ABC-type glycerol-3-phosphate transport system substrate-binding protein
MKRTFLLTTILILLFTQLTACTKKAQTGSWVKDKKLDRVTLTICLPSNPGVYSSKYTGTLLKEVVKELGKKAEQELNVKINITNLKLKNIGGQGATGEITTNFQEAMNGNNPCDMFFLNSNSRRFSINEFSLSTLYDAGLIKDITNLFPENAPNYFGLFSREELDTVSNDGKILAVPSYKLPDTKRVHAIVRENLLKKYKIKNISSYEEYESFLETIRKNEPEMIPTDILPTTLEMFAAANGYIVAANTSNYVNKQIGLELVYRADDPAMKLMDWK